MAEPTFHFRATVLPNGTVRLVEHLPWLVTGGPLMTLVHARGRARVAIADLTVLRDEHDVAVEVVVAFCCGDGPAARDALRRWAAFAGYRRIWFDGAVDDLEPTAGGTATTRCTGCRARYVDGAPTLWDHVRRRGAFPTACALCGGDLPQWSALEPADEEGAPVGRRSRSGVGVSDHGFDRRPT